MKYLYNNHAYLSSPPRGGESNWATVGPKPRPAAWPLPRLFRGGQARDGAEARVPVATAPPRGGPRPSWYVRVRGGPTRGEPSHPTGSTGAAPPYTCGALARLRSSRRSHVANPQGHWLSSRSNGCSAAAFGNTCGRETADLLGGRPGVGIGAPSMPNAPAYRHKTGGFRGVSDRCYHHRVVFDP